MKRYLEVEEGVGEEVTIIKVKKLKDKELATKDATKKTYEHYCFHDEPDYKGSCRPCTRKEIK